MPEYLNEFPTRDDIRIHSLAPINAFTLRRTLNEIKPDILIGCGGGSGGGNYGFCSALSNYKPFILFIWGSEVLLPSKLFPLRAMVKYSLKKSDLVLVDSQVQVNACIKLGCERKKIIRFPWFDFEDFYNLIKNIKEEKQKFRTNLGWYEDDPIIICTRWHEEVYNVDGIIKAIPSIVAEVPNARFLFLGEGSLTDYLGSLAHILNVEKNVHFAGRIPRNILFYYLKNSDVYISNSSSDGTSSSLLEAMICKLPCVVSNIPGNREWVTNLKTGILFPTNDAKLIAEKIKKVLSDRNLRTELSERAFRRLKQRANWYDNSDVLYTLMENLVKKYHSK